MTTATSGDPDVRLDAALVAQTVPPGSLRYHALLYAAADKRDFLVALHLLEDELRTTGRSVHHDVAHTRLKWWHDELERLAKGTPAHPATKVLASSRALPGVDLALLKGLVEAAAIDLARVTFADEAELAGYFDRTGGVLGNLAARWLLAPRIPPEGTCMAAARLGALIRQVDALCTLRSNVHAGRVQVPLATLDRLGIRIEDLGQQPWSPAVQALVRSTNSTIEAGFAEAIAAIDSSDRTALRPLLVAVALHARWLAKLASQAASIPVAPPELGAFEKLATAWRAARRAR